MKSKEARSSVHLPLESLLARLSTSFLEAGWIAAAVLSALFMNIYTHRMFEPDKAALIRSLAILMFVAWLIKIIEHRVLIKSRPPDVRSGDRHPDTFVSGSGLKYSILLPAGLYFFSYLISSLTSVLPASSFWGSYDRMQGLYTTIAYFAIFWLAATHIKRPDQVERLISAIILTSLPVMCYGLVQKLGWDVIPWQMMDPTKRISSTMGNPIFFAAYLIVVVPLVLARVFSLLHNRPPSGTNLARLTHRFKIGLYSFVLLLQIVSIALTQSRGPLLGLVGGVAFFFFIYALLYKKKTLLWLLVGGLGTASVFVVIFNLPQTPLEPLKKVPILERFGRLNPSEGSARVRIILWGMATKLMRDNYNPSAGPPHPELIGAAPWRFLLGYGPETLGNIFYRYHTKELVDFEGRTVHGDNCHNILFNSFVTQGVFGLFTFLFLISGALYLGLRTIKQIKRINQINPFTAEILILGIVSAIVAHFIETLFGLGIVVTYTHFWLFLALLYAIPFVGSEAVPDPLRRPARTDQEASATGGGTSQFLVSLLFWTYLGVSLVVVVVVVTEFWPSLDTNIKAWITGTYLWLFGGLLLGTISLCFTPAPEGRGSPKGRPAQTPPARTGGVVSSSFNLLGYLGLAIAAFFLIRYSNFNLILADGYYKFSFSADNESEKTRRTYYQTGRRRRGLLQKQSQTPLSGAEAKQLQGLTRNMRQKLSLMFKLRLDSITCYQDGLRLTPRERTYLNGMGRNFLELAKVWRNVVAEGWSLSLPSLAGGFGPGKEIDLKTQGVLSGPPSMEKIMGFRPEDYYKFNQYDFFYCCFTTIRRAYELEPSNYERRLAMAQVYRYGAIMTGRDPDPKRRGQAHDYFKKAMDFYRLAKEASPKHPVVDEYIKTMQREMRGRR